MQLPFHKKSRAQRLAEPLTRSLDSVHPPKALKSGLAVLGGMADATAMSAAVSSLRRHQGGARHDS